MAKGDNLKGKKTGNNFALNPQPSGAAKAAGLRHHRHFGHHPGPVRGIRDRDGAADQGPIRGAAA